MTIATFTLAALDCPDPVALAGFYQQIVGGEIKASPSADWVRLYTPGEGSDLGFQRVDNYRAPGWPDGDPQQAHFDFDVDDIERAEAEVIAIGAIKAEVQPEPTEWRVFLDPAGHPFCLILR